MTTPRPRRGNSVETGARLRYAAQLRQARDDVLENSHTVEDRAWFDATDYTKYKYLLNLPGKTTGSCLAAPTFRRRVAATPRLARGYSVEANRGDAAAATWKFCRDRLAPLRYSRNLNHLWATGGVVLLWDEPIVEWYPTAAPKSRFS